MHAGCLAGILALPPRFLRPHELLDLPPAREESTPAAVSAFFRSVVDWFIKPEYRAFLLVAAGMNFAYTPIQSSFSMLPYMLEDMGDLPSQRAIQDFVSLWMGAGQTVLGAITLPLGLLVDRSDALHVLLFACLVGAVAFPSYFTHDIADVRVSLLLALFAGQVMFSAIIPFTLLRILKGTDQANIGRDVSGIYALSGIISSCLTGLQGVVPLPAGHDGAQRRAGLTIHNSVRVAKDSSWTAWGRWWR